MAVSGWQAVVQDQNGRIQPGAEVTVRHADSGAIATLYSNRSGTTPMPNPFLANSEGYLRFFAVGGAYRVTATRGTFSTEWPYVAVGTAQEFDIANLVAGAGADVQVDTLADRAEYDAEPEGFSVMVSDIGDGRAAIYARSGTGWTDPAFITGAPGPEGPLGPQGPVGDVTPEAEAARDAAALSEVNAATSESNALDYANVALSSKTQAELAALAAGAPLFTSEPDLGTAPSPYLLQVEAGTQVWTHDGTDATMVGWLGKVEFPTVAALKAFAGPLGPDGTEISAQGFRYEVAASGAVDEHLTTAGGVKLYALPGSDGAYNAKAFGLVADGVVLDDDAISAINTFISANPGCQINFPDCKINVSEGVFFDLQDNVTMCAVGRVESNCGFRWGQLVQQDVSLLPTYGTASAPAGAREIALTDSGDTSQFAIGDFIFLLSGTTYISGGGTFFEMGLLTQITDIVGSTLHFTHPLPEATKSSPVVKVVPNGEPGPSTGEMMKVISGARLIGDWNIHGLDRPYPPFNGGMVDCVVDITSVDSFDCVYGNGFTACHIKIKSVSSIRYLFEAACQSVYNIVDVQYHKVVGEGFPGYSVIRYSENALFNTIRVNVMDALTYSVGQYLFSLFEGRYNNIDINRLFGGGSGVASISVQDRGASSQPCIGNTITVRWGALLNGLGEHFFFNSNGFVGLLADNLVLDTYISGPVGVNGRAVRVEGTRNGVRNCRFSHGRYYTVDSVYPIVDSSYFPLGYQNIPDGVSIATPYITNAGVQAFMQGLFAPGGMGLEVGGAKILSGLNSPEGVLSAAIGSVYLNVGGGTNPKLYIKASGTGNTGWVAVSTV